MSDAVLAALHARHATLDAALSRLAEGAASGALDADEHAALKTEIAALYREIERELTELAALRGAVRLLIDRWKAVRPPSAVPPAASVRADHLNASSYVEKGWSRISAGDHAGAERLLARALELVPGDVQAEALLGWAVMLQGRHDDALARFQRVLARDPANGLARANVGYICLRRGRFHEAAEHLTAVVRADTDRKAMLYAHHYLGLLHLERGMHEEAAGCFRRAVALGPNLIEAHYELGRALWLAGDADGARGAWRAGATANKFNPWGTRCAEVLELAERGEGPPALGA